MNEKKVLHEDSKVKVKGLDALMEKYSSDASFKKLVEDMQLVNGDNPLMIFGKEDKVSRFTLWQTPGEPIKEFKFNGEMVPGVKVKERPSLSLTTALPIGNTGITLKEGSKIAKMIGKNNEVIILLQPTPNQKRVLEKGVT